MMLKTEVQLTARRARIPFNWMYIDKLGKTDGRKVPPDKGHACIGQNGAGGNGISVSSFSEDEY